MGRSEEIGARVRRARELAGYRLETAAERLGVSRGHLSHMERGQRGVSLDLLIAMSELYGAGVGYLVMGEEAVEDDPAIRRVVEELKRLPPDRRENLAQVIRLWVEGRD